MKYMLPCTALVVMVLVGLWWYIEDNAQRDTRDTRDTPPWVATTRPKTFAYDPASEVPSAVVYRLGHQLWEEKGKGRWADVTRQVFEEDRRAPTQSGYVCAPWREYVVWGGKHIVQAIVNESIRSVRSWDPQRLRSALVWDGTELTDPVLDAAEMVLRQSDAPELRPTDNCIFLILYVTKYNDASSISVRLHLARAMLEGGQYRLAQAPKALVAKFADAAKAVMPGDNIMVSFDDMAPRQFRAFSVGTFEIGAPSRTESIEAPVGAFTGKWKRFGSNPIRREFIAPNIGCIDRYVDGTQWILDVENGRTIFLRSVVDGLILRLKDKVVVKRLDSKKD